MKKILLIILINFFLINFFNMAFAQIKSDIVLKIENRIITNYELKNKIISSLILSDQTINQENIDRYKNSSLEFLIQLKLKQIELSKFNFVANKLKINSYLNQISSNNIDNLKNEFKKNGIDFQLLYDEIETEFKWQNFIYQNYSKKVIVDDNAINTELENLVNSKSNIEEFNLSKIEILLENNNSDKQKISELEDQINNFGFDYAANNFNISSAEKNKGNLGWINEKSLSKNIYVVVKNLGIGKISKPIKSQDSIIYLKLNDKRTSKINNNDLNEIKNNIINQKKNELFTLYSKSHLSKLRNRSLIEFK
jgi:peptidyl-prolyl cis-trans isomerase SurA